VLAVLRKERGAEVVAPVLTGAVISAVNYSEVLKKTVEVGGQIHVARALLHQCKLHIVAFDADHAAEAAALYPQTSSRGLSFADRACIALGLRQGIPVFTAEKRFAELGLPVKIRVIR
jgi:PIN domain nuclease of toxin-antitoxin system